MASKQQLVTVDEFKALLRAEWDEETFQRAVIIEMQNAGFKVAHFRRVRVQRKNGQVYWETPVQADGKGFMDLIAVRRERLLAIELKVGKNTLTKNQTEWLEAMGAVGAETAVFFPRDWPTILEWLR
jgi:hypothetical protein